MMIHLKKYIQWTSVILLVGTIVGSISAFFLVSLDYVTNTRESQFIWVLLLPLGGLIIGYTYYFLSKGVEGGNNRLINEMIVPKRKIHWKMTPLVLFGTLATHLFGGSAGREGTAIQMGGATADQFSFWFNWGERQRKIILRMGVAAGFASIFGTPIAGIFFAYELGRDKKLDFTGIIPIILVSFLANLVCDLWQVEHTHYVVNEVTPISFTALFWVVIAGIIFGLAALCFNYCKQFFNYLFARLIKYAPLRPFIGGIIIVGVVFLLDTTKYLGLGLPTIVDAFSNPANNYDFIIKLLLTAFTLGAGFKGGEATPLFFMGATLGSILVWFIPLPVSLLAGMGFIAVFSGATNTPIACTFIGVELFGWEGILYFFIACLIAYLISGRTSVYATQQKYLRKLSVIQYRKMNKQ